ncbi:hypothetical protein KR009_011018, partial [Drosophila setifemur]
VSRKAEGPVRTSSMHVEQSAIGRDGHDQELYFYCETCCNAYEDSEAFAMDHIRQSGCCGGVVAKEELGFVEKTTAGKESEEIMEAEVPLWEVVEVAQTSAETKLSQSERYFCYDCHSIFENRSSAEDHVCPRAEACSVSSPQPDVATAERFLARRKYSNPDASASTLGLVSGVNCEICNTVFSSVKFLKLHMRIHKERVPKSIQDALPVGAHQQYSELDQFYCEICNKSFDENLLDVHKQMHQKMANEIMCSTCNRKFDNLINYKMHLKIHDKPGDAVAPSKSARSLNASSDKEKHGFPCQFCERVFSRPYEKVKHERVHTGEKPYACEVCGKTFRVSYSLTLHLRTHTDIRPYVCTVCNKRFKSHPVYSHHLRIHSSERDFVCDMCSKTFRTSVQLYAHRNTHTKPYLCAVCNRPFSSMYAVKIHMQTHEDEKSEIPAPRSGSSVKSQPARKICCRTCGAQYARLFALRLHMKSAHGLAENTSHMQQGQPYLTEDRHAKAEDSESDVLIAAAEAEAAYIGTGGNYVNVVGSVPTYEESVEFDVVNFHSEEIITDWHK